MLELLQAYKKVRVVPMWDELQVSTAGVDVVVEDWAAKIVQVRAKARTDHLNQALDTAELLKFRYGLNPYLSIRITPLKQAVKCDPKIVRSVVQTHGFTIKAIGCNYKRYKEIAVKNVPLHQYDLLNKLLSLSNDLRFITHFLKVFLRF